MPCSTPFRWLLAWSCLLALLPAQQVTNPRPPKPGAKVAILFIGNSYTFANDLPAFVRALGSGHANRLVLPAAVGTDVTLIDLPDEEGRRLRAAVTQVLAPRRR